MTNANASGGRVARSTFAFPFASEGLLIASATLGGYVVTFLYEYGYGNYFGIPADAVEVSLTTVLVTLGLVGPPLLWGIYLLIVADVFSTPSVGTPASDPTQVLVAKLAPVVFLAILSFGFVVFADTWWPTLWMLVAVWTVSLWLLLAPLAVSRKRHITFAAAVAEVHDRQVKARGLGYAFTRLVELGVYVPAVLLVGLALGAYLFGNFRAKAESDFWINASAPNQVVLRMYGNRLVLARLDRDAKTVSRALTFATVDGAGIKLRKESVGPLTRSPSPTIPG